MGPIDKLDTEEDALAAEGYRALCQDTGRFAEDAIAVAGEIWPKWDDGPNEEVDPPDAGAQRV